MAEDGPLQRGFTLQHQRVVLDIDLSGVIKGSAYLTIDPRNPSLRTVHLHASHLLDIHQVTLASPTNVNPLLPTPASYALTNPFQPLPTREPPIDLRSHPEIKRKTWSAMSEQDEGELAISVSGGWVRLLEGEARLAPIEIRIDYSLVVGRDVVDGIVFHDDHVFTTSTTYDSARIWTPCVDNLWERCTWELDFIVPKTIHDVAALVVSSGELQEQVTHPHNPNKVIFSYLQTIPTSVQHVAFAVGAFQLYAHDRILIFCLPGDYEEAVAAGSTLHKALSFFSTEFGTYPYQDFKAVFIPDTPVTTSAALAIVPTTLLHPPNVIEQAITTRETLSLCLAQQWVGINIIPRTLSDTWIVNGLALYIHSLFLRLLFGNNEYRFRLRRDIERCVRQDIGKDPICVPGTLAIDTPFINAKSPLVLHILDKHLAKAGTSLGLSRVIPRIFLAAFSDELSGNTLSTQYFFRACRKLSSMDLSTFADQWVYGSRCPHFRITSNFIRKKFTVELNVTQTPLFEGSLTVRIHEADGAPFEHVLDIKQPSKTFNLPFNTKYKRTRRSGRIAARFNQLQEDLAADEPESMAEVFAYPPWDDDEVRAEWRVADWSDENATAMLGEVGGYEWIRIDPELEWLATFEFVEKPWYWISQLQGDRDVVAQFEAIQNMRLYATPVVASELAKTVLVKNYYYRVRMEAARALVTYNTSECDYIGLFLLLKLFDDLYGSRPNDFSSFPDYFVKKTLITALAELRDPTTRTTWPQVRELLLNLLRSNDNTTNQYADSHYLATLITAIGNAFSASDDDSARGDLDRAMTMDRLVPSYHNLVTQAGLQTHLKMILAGQRTNDPKLFLAYTRDGNFNPVRIIAFDCLLLCRPPGRSMSIARYLLDVVRTDSSLGVRRHVAKALSEAILMSLAIGEVFTQPPGVVEGDEAEVAERQNLLIVKALRKEFAPRADFKQSLQASLISSFTDADHDVRFALLKVAEMITSSQVEPLPGNLITIQTPVETPSLPTPRIRISMGDAKEYFPTMISAPPPAPVKLTLSANKKVPKSQTKGLPDSDLAAINVALAKLRADKRSTPFRHPVDPVRDHAPDYNVVIKVPMDLSTAAAKLESGMYTSRQDFAADMRLIVSNCYAYNKKGDPMFKAGQVFEAFFNNMWNKTEATLSSAMQPPISVPPPIPAVAATPPVAPPRPQPKLIIRPPSESVPPMAPPPVPHRKAEKEKPKPPPKRKSHGEVDAILGEELDAIERTQPRPASPEKPPKKVKPVSEKPAIKIPPPVVPPAKVAAAAPKAPATTPKAPTATPKALPPAPVPVPSTRPRPPSDIPPTVQNTMSFKSRRAKGLIATLSKDSRAILFLHPVDPIRDGCPTYLDEIKEPMDFGTISTRIDAKHYKTMGQFAYDIELVFNNCRQFNPPGEITALADGLEAVYWKEWPKAVSPKMTGDEKKATMSLINRALKEPISLFFREAVDPVALGIPQYFDIIPKEDARDLSLIKNKLNSSQYSTMHQLDEDVELMLENARIFNGEGPVVDAANVLGKWWTEQRGKME